MAKILAEFSTGWFNKLNIAAQLNGKSVMMSNEIFLTSIIAPIAEKILFAGFARFSLTAAGCKKIATESGNKLLKNTYKFRRIFIVINCFKQ